MNNERRDVAFGDLRRVTPIAREFGYERGQPIDRHYIEAFLEENAPAIRGNVLEIGDSGYTRRFGGPRVTKSDVLHVTAGNPAATIVGDLSRAEHIPSDCFDCIICTQTLQYVYDLPAAARTLARILKPSGVLLVTVPGISQLDDPAWNSLWCWSFTPISTRRLFEDAFAAQDVEARAHGNVLAAVAFLHGLSASELTANELSHADAAYPCLITVRAVKPALERANRPSRGEGTTSSTFVVSADVSFDGIDRQALAGASIDVPRSGTFWNAHALPIEGWAVGRDDRVREIEVVADGRSLLQLPLSVERPDVASHLAGASTEMNSGFRGSLDAGGLAVDQVDVRAVLESGAHGHIGRLHLSRSWPSGSHPAERDVVSIVIPCFNQAHFVSDAIESARAQRYDKVEIVVVDDGSTDNTSEVVARYNGVRYVHQPNQGLPSARNTGISRSNGQFLVFLDADDRLEPDAAGIGVNELRRCADCAFVSGEHRNIGVDGRVLAEWQRPLVTADHYTALLKGNYIGCIAAVVFRRAALQAVGGFDARLDACEDYDLYLRIARSFPVGAHDNLVAEYRRHGSALSDNPARMLRAALAVLDAQRRFVTGDRLRKEAFKQGRRYWQRYYGEPLAARIRMRLAHRGTRVQALKELLELSRSAPTLLATVAWPAMTAQRRR
jgi:glycosyltransferase involved in cell wall biosynthesis/SAM-dependent methyltransferase